MKKWIAAIVLAMVLFGAQQMVRRVFSVTQLAPLAEGQRAIARSQTDPITNPQPPSTLLPAGATTVALTVQTAVDTACAFAVGEAAPFSEMTPFDAGAGTTSHQMVVSGLNPDPNTVNEVYVRCAADPLFVLPLRYRSLSHPNPSYPRVGNLWGSKRFLDKDPADVARIDLWLGAGFKPEQIRQLRKVNPHILVLTSLNAIEDPNLPDDYYLKDIHGQRVEVWPGYYRLNLTKSYVAEHQAQRAYELILNSDLMFDGIFFDNVMTTQSWQTQNIYGQPFLVDANEDGVQDDPKTFDAAWKAGVFYELATFRALMPHAIVSGHSMNIDEPGIASYFNGISMGFWPANVIEGEMLFEQVWHTYESWHRLAQPPVVTMFEASPLDQIAYGYGYAPWADIPPSTLEFARTYYPWMRFGLALTFMNDGYFAYEYGDTWHGQDWWYDELDFDLGYPIGPAQQIELANHDSQNLVENGNFEQPTAAPWTFWANQSADYVATVTRDTGDAAVGAASTRVDIETTAGTSWQITLAQYNRSLERNTIYDLTFWAKSDQPRTISLYMQKGSPEWDGYGLSQKVPIGTTWQEYTVSFAANATIDDARLQFAFGETTGTVWLDHVRLNRHPADLYRREFTNGLVLLNGSRDPQEIAVGPGWQRLFGQQAPRTDWIIDDDTPSFSTSGTWGETTYDSGEWKTSGPFYHNWGKGLHEH